MNIILNSADHCGYLDLRFSDGLLHEHLVADAVLHLLLPPILGDHQVILCDLLPHLTALNLAAPLLHDLLLEQIVALSGVQAVSLRLLHGLLLVEGHQEVSLILVGSLESFLLPWTRRRSRDGSRESASSSAASLGSSAAFSCTRAPKILVT